MRDEMDENEVQPAMRPRDTEVTLGPMTVASLFFGLLLLCGLCFGLGYSMGSRGSRDSVFVGAQPGTPAGSQSKPVAAPALSPQPQTAATDSAPSDASIANPAAASLAGGSSAQPAPAAGGPPAVPLMVQIATVTQQEDADVLVGALRKRGYAVAVAQDPADGQFHVRIGPFASLTDANAAREKLLNDGYNAVVQP
ncbi:MAG: SPOR domain-containing protein [Terracidiphilus sp.]|jgi:cell division septation protein DedD